MKTPVCNVPFQGATPRARSHRANQRQGIGRLPLLAVCGVLMLASSLVLVWWIFGGSKIDTTDQLQLGLRIARRGDFATAARLAQSIDESQLTRRNDTSTRHFLIGADARHTAQAAMYRPTRTEQNERAVEHLQKSQSLRFPPGYEGLGNYLLGMALFELFRWNEAKKPLSIASERWPKGRSDSVECLIDIGLYGETANPDAAAKELERWAALAALTPEDLDRIAVKRMEILMMRGERKEIGEHWKTINRQSPMRPNANLILARCLRQEASSSSPDQRQARWSQALVHLKEIESLQQVPSPIRRRAMLEQGLIYRDSQQTQKAISTFSSVRLSSPFEPEFMMAGIEEIDALIDLKMLDATTVTLEQLNKNFVDPKWYDNCWMPVKRMRERLLASANRMLEQGSYASAERFVSSLPSMCSEIDRLRLSVAIYGRWARSLQKEKAANANSVTARNDDDSVQMEKIFRQSAQSIERLCMLDMRSPDFMELLWRGIEDYHFANDHLGSNRLIERFLNLAPRADQAKALLMRARNHAAAGESNLALSTIDQLILTAPDSPALPDARLTAAKLHWSLGNFDQAEALILDNLYSGNLLPESPVWKESLIELGTLMFRQGEQMQVRILGSIVENNIDPQNFLPELEQSYQQLLRSIDSMEEGLRRFQGDARRYQLLYMTAKAYRMAAYWPETLLQGNRLVSEEAVSQWKAKRKELLVSARETFATLRQEITTDGDTGVVVPNSESLLCNSFFGEADLLFHDGNFRQALDAYRAAANRFINEPESLEAFVQIARCHEGLAQISEMRRTLEMAADVLNRIPADRDERFLTNTRQSRSGWENQLRWMIDEIDRKAIN